MSVLERVARQAQRRLWLNRWLAALGWSLAGAAGLFVLAVVIERVWIAADETGAFFSLLTLGLTLVALLTSVIWASITRDSLHTSAAQLDKAAGLKERISTGLYCETSGDPFAHAVVSDAHRASRNLRIRTHLPLRLPTSANYAGGTIVVALLFFWLFPVVDLAGKQEQRQEDQKHKQLVDRARAEIKPVIDQQVKKLGEKYPELKKELERIKPMPDANVQRPEDIPNEPIKQINKINDQLQEKKNSLELEKIEAFKKLARQLAAENDDSLAGKLAEALSKGDFAAAQEALDALRLQLSKAPETEEEKKRADELKQQLADLSGKLGQAAQAQKNSEQDLKKAGLSSAEVKRALEHLNKKDIEAVKKMLGEKGLSKKEIDRLAQQLKQNCSACKMASKLAQSLNEGAQGAQGSGKLSDSAEAGFSEAGDQLSEMESLEQQLNQLSAMAADLDAMKDQLSQCQGQCPGQGQTPSRSGMGNLGRGQGGIAPEEETKYDLQKERTRVNTLPGEIISTKYVHGEQFDGEVSDEFIQAVLSARRDVSDAIAREQIPRLYHKSLKEYFDHSRDALPAKKVEAVEGKMDAEAPDAE